MNKYLTPFTNWRTHVLAVLAMAALVFLVSEPDDSAPLSVYLAVKAAGFALAYVIYRLGKYWNSKGKINELMALASEED